MGLLQTFLNVIGIDVPDTHPLSPDAPDDVAALRRMCTDLQCERRSLMIERDCFKAELLRAPAPGGGPLFTEKSLALRVRMYDRALRARVKAMKAMRA